MTGCYILVEMKFRWPTDDLLLHLLVNLDGLPMICCYIYLVPSLKVTKLSSADDWLLHFS